MSSLPAPSKAFAEQSHAFLDPRHRDFVQTFLAELVKNKLVDELGAARARDAHLSSGQRIDTVITELGMVTSTELLGTFAALYNIPIATPLDFPDEAVLSEDIPKDFLARACILPFRATSDTLEVLIPDPFALTAAKALGYHLRRSVICRLAPPADISAAIARLYELNPSLPENAAPLEGAVSEDDLQRLKDIASEAPTVQLVNRMIGAAVTAGASDIHIEAQADALRVRYRIDGAVCEVNRLPLDAQAAIVTRIKIISKLNIAERRLPQDGRIKFVVSGREIDLRVSVNPILHGESIVIRILDRQHIRLDLDALGFDPEQAQLFHDLLRQPNGIILVTGPTGSGKTTTLYAALSLLNTVDRTIFSVEDPVEYQIAGVNQMHVRPAIGLDFAQCLRSILRQDPDIILVGEMRDGETVRIGIQASLTGHLVLSTLHTNSAAASVTRLLDMGAQDYLLASTLNAVIAQRLVRRLCTCAVSAPDARTIYNSATRDLGRPWPIFEQVAIKVPVGCPTCRQTGYNGRTNIVEMLVFNPTLRPLIRAGVAARELEDAARSQGMETLYECGLRKVFAGETSYDELVRATRC